MTEFINYASQLRKYSVKLAFFEETITGEWGYQDIRCPEPPLIEVVLYLAETAYTKTAATARGFELDLQ